MIDQGGITKLVIDPYTAWLAENTAVCQRMNARITDAVCRVNQHQSNFDCRCTGCGGLFDQETITAVRPDRVLLRALDEIIETSERNTTTQHGATADNFDDIELDLDDEQLLKLFPELLYQKDDEDHEEIIEKRFTEYQEPVQPRRFYSGTCKRCGGYVEDTRERFDHNVFHCLICGWRTSPDYEANRRIQSKGGKTI